MTRCVHQVFRPYFGLPLDMRVGLKRGDCTICTTDERNKECTGYCPVHIHELQVEKPKGE